VAYTPIIAAGYIASWSAPGSSAWAQITGLTETIDTNSCFANDAFTVPATGGGKYLVSFTAFATPTSGSTYIAPSIDGTEQTNQAGRSGTPSDCMAMCAIITLTAGQVLTFESMTSGASADTTTNGVFNIIKLSD